MKKLILSLMLIALLASCQKRIETNCPQFPIPSDHVKQVLDDIAKTDKEMWLWGNELHVLCMKLGTCKINEDDK